MEKCREQDVRHAPLQNVRVPVLRVLRHDDEEEDSMQRFEEGWDNIFVVLREVAVPTLQDTSMRPMQRGEGKDGIYWKARNEYEMGMG